MRRPLALGTLVLALTLAGCSKDFVLDPPHDSPRDPNNPNAPGVPPQPGSLTVESIQSTGVTLRWTMSDSSGVGEYRILTRAAGETDFRTRASTVIQRGTLAGLQSGVLYEIAVTAVNTNGLEGPASEAVSARPASLALLIDNNAVVTNQANVVLSTNALGYDQIRVGDSPATLPTGYQNLAGDGTIGFALTGGDGIKTLYAQFRVGSSGAESQVVSDDIRLDRVASIGSMTYTGSTTPGGVLHLKLVAGETDGEAVADIGTVRTGIRLLDDGSSGDPVAGDGNYETNYTVERNFDAVDAPVIGRFVDRAGNVATPVQAATNVTIANPPSPVTLQAALSQGGGRVLLQWSQSGATDFLAYRVWHSTASPVITSPSRILDTTVTVRTATTVITDSLAVGVAERFVIEVVDQAGNAAAGNELTVTPTAAAAPGASALSAPALTSRRTVAATPAHRRVGSGP